jgi:outer membrane receptor protein involved in Fe transport
MPRLRPFGWLQIDGRLYLREIPIYQEGVRGFEVQAAPTIKLWPSDGLSLELSYTHSDIQRSRAGTHFSTQDLTRVKAQYQFTKALFARAIVQYNLRSRDALRDADTGLPLISLSGASTAPLESGDFGTNLLVSYQPSPGTLVYLGWARQMTGPDTYRLDRLERTAEGLFVKFSYLHRL